MRKWFTVVALLLASIACTAQVSSRPLPRIAFQTTHVGLQNTLATQTVTGLANGYYRVSVYIWTTVANTAGSCQVTTTYNNGTAGYGGNLASALNTAVTTVPREANQMVVVGNNQIQYGVTCSGFTGTPTFNLRICAEYFGA